ncbi:MAG: hypothetical protein JW862_08430 [Anaerolineales bacterium]|nr:hypothetical protein [Anaerolineales bacterium]
MSRKTLLCSTTLFALLLLGLVLVSLSGPARAADPLLPSAPQTPNTGFSIQAVTSNALTDTHASLAVDSNGKAHIAYEQEQNIFYATNASGSWISTVIATDAGPEVQPSIALDSAGKAYLSYFVGTYPNQELHYATNTSGSWNSGMIETVSVPGWDRLETSIAVDGAGLMYVVYATYAGSDYDINLRYQDGTVQSAPQGGWVTQPLTDNALDDRNASIAVTSDGKVHVVYHQFSNTNFADEIHYATNASGSWVDEVLFSEPFLNFAQPAIVLDASAKAHLVYYSWGMGSNHQVYYATNRSGSWITSTVSAAGYDVWGTAIDLDSNGAAHIAYSAYSSEYQIVYASNSSGSWVTETLSTVSEQDYLTKNDRALVVDGNDYVHIAFHGLADASDDEIFYAHSDQPVSGGGGTCAAPLPLACGEVINGSTLGQISQIDGYTCGGWDESGPEDIYAITTPAFGTWAITATLSNETAELDVFFVSQAGCAAGECLEPGSYGLEQAVIENVAPGSYYLSVDGYSGAAGDYTLSITCERLDSNNTPPATPDNPLPAHSATGVNTIPQLFWDTGDPDGHDFAGIVYGSTSNPPAIQLSNLWCNEVTQGSAVRQDCFGPPLATFTTYYWQVLVEDELGALTYGPVWSFTTGAGDLPFLLYLPLTDH